MPEEKSHNSTPELEGVDELSLAAFRALRDVMRVNRQEIAKRFGAKGAHIGQAACLRVLHSNDGCTQREIADILHISRPSITGILQAVEKSGAIIRKPDEADQRLMRVYLTDQGRAIAADLRIVLSEYIMRTLGELPEADRQELARLLGKLREKIASAAAVEREDCAE